MSRFKSMDVEENVACNLIPMIDIMFLLLLFFMLSADMTTRVAEDIKIPRADRVKEDQKSDDTPTTVVNLIGEGDNWYVKILGQGFPDWELLRFKLNELAQEDPDEGNAPGKPYFTKRAIMLRAESDAPYKAVQRLIQMSAKLGYYKIEVVAMKPEVGGPVVTK